MCKLAGINFGYADSEKELLETPELFDSAFVDPRNYLSKLMYGLPFLVLGRKGTGKTAYGAKIRRLAMENNDIIVHPCMLSDLNYSTFETFADESVRGGRRFLYIWKYLLFLEIIKLIQTTFPENENSELNILIQSLQEYGILPTEDIVHTAKHLNTTNISLSIPNIISAGKNAERELVLSSTDEITDIGIKILQGAYFGEKNFYIIIDGLDDALRGKQFSSDIITGLIRAAESINYKLRLTLHLKIIILLRSDIFELCRDPDLTKIKRDSTINLSWTKEDLQDIVIKRIKNKYPQYQGFDEFWREFAPQRYKDKKSSTFLFELTLLRPRDILQFFIECQDLYGKKSSLTYSEFSTTIAGYSKNYFISEMKDELTGVFSDKIVTAIPAIFSELGNRTFYEEELQQIILSQNIEISARKMLETMYSSGYIGQVRLRDGEKQFVSFSHVNPFDKFSPTDKCILHRGLVKALNI
jgi:hypothetical protein